MQSRQSRRTSRTGGAVLLIFLGIFFLLQQQHLLPNNLNWWALFIMLPGFVLLFEAVNQRKETNTLPTEKVAVGSFLILIGFVFLLNIVPSLPWTVIWPILLILGGVAMLFRTDRKNGHQE